MKNSIFRYFAPVIALLCVGVMNAASAIYTVNKVFNGHTYTINLDTTQINVDMIFTPMHDVEFPIVNVGDPEPDDVEHWSFDGPKKASQFSGLQRAEGVVKLILTGKDEYTVADIDAHGSAIKYINIENPTEDMEVKVWYDSEPISSGVDRIYVDEVDGATYNVLGQKVSDNYRGFVIKNGKKVIIR